MHIWDARSQQYIQVRVKRRTIGGNSALAAGVRQKATSSTFGARTPARGKSDFMWPASSRYRQCMEPSLPWPLLDGGAHLPVMQRHGSQHGGRDARHLQ